MFAFLFFLQSLLLSGEDESLFSKCRYDVKTIEAYYRNLERLEQSEDWDKILFQGEIALEASRRTVRPWDEANISAQLATTAVHLRSFEQALVYATRCRELAQELEDQPLLLLSLHLEEWIKLALAERASEQG